MPLTSAGHRCSRGLDVADLDFLVEAAVQVALGSHQGLQSVVEASELLLQLQLSTPHVPDFDGPQRAAEEYAVREDQCALQLSRSRSCLPSAGSGCPT